MCSCLISDLGPSWDEETVALLLGRAPGELAVVFLPADDVEDDGKSATRRARLAFGSRDEMWRTVAAYQGLAVPMTHGYHYYSFSDVDSDGDGGGCSAGSETPPLHLQLMALPTTELQRRLGRLGSASSSVPTKSHRKGGHRTCKVHKQASLAYHLAKAMGGDRPTKRCLGVPVPDGSTDSLLDYLRTSATTLWPPPDKQRKGVSAGNYLTVRANRPPEHDEIWSLCKELINSAIPDAVYNALAITRGFCGSPHVDNHDTTFQHVIALGDYEGGRLCAEADDDGNEVVEIDVQNRFGRIDGRAVHWVSGWKGERYSVVYYSTSDDDSTERESQPVHMKWMEKVRCKVEGSKSGRVPQRLYARGNTRLPNEVPILGLGCSSFSTFFASGDEEPLTVDTMSRDHVAVRGWVETIRHAVVNRGITLLDTAPWYGHGTSEVTIGYALDTILSNDDEKMQSAPPSIRRRKRAGTLPRSRLIVNTKVGRYEADPLKQFDFTYDTTIMSVQRSLERMNSGYIDVIQLHDPEFAPSLRILKEETVPALLECRKRGWAKAIGLTGYPLEVQHRILVECQGLSGDGAVFDQSLVYCHNNLHDMSLFFCDDCFPLPDDAEGKMEAENKGKSVSFAQFCRQSNVRLMAAAPLSMGLLTNSGPPDWHPAEASLKEACAAAAKLCESKGVNISSLAVLYSLSQRQVGCTLLGMKDIREVDAAADLAVRFCGIDFDSDQGKEATDNQLRRSNAILDHVMTPAEKEVLALLLDQSCGPFADVTSNGCYRWDGKEEAKKFWALVDEMQKG